jgi:hypothetical protein
MKLREGKVYGESRYSQVSRERTGGGKPRGIVVKAPRDQPIANLTVELLMEWFSRCSVEPNHLESDDRVAAPLLIELFTYTWFHSSNSLRILLLSKPVLTASTPLKWSALLELSGLLTLYHKPETFLECKLHRLHVPITRRQKV